MLIFKWILFGLLCISSFWQIINIIIEQISVKRVGYLFSFILYILLAIYIFMSKI